MFKMNQKKSGLGRGIGALIPQVDQNQNYRAVDVFFPEITDKDTGYAKSKIPVVTGAIVDRPTKPEVLTAVPGASLQELNPEDILPNEHQPRKDFNAEDLAELVHSIREFGVLQPIVVRTHPTQSGKYELVMGERRLRATKASGRITIPAVIKDTANEDMLRDALLENLHRSQLNPLEEASAYQQLLADFGITQDQLSSKIGRSRSQISNTIRLLRLPESVQLKVAAGVLSAGHARAILAAGTEVAIMVRIADRIINEDLSVRAAEMLASENPKVKSNKPRPGKRQDFLNAIADRMGDQLNTRVKVVIGARKGQINIEFSTVDDLRRILTELGQDIGGL